MQRFVKKEPPAAGYLFIIVEPARPSLGDQAVRCWLKQQPIQVSHTVDLVRHTKRRVLRGRRLERLYRSLSLLVVFCLVLFCLLALALRLHRRRGQERMLLQVRLDEDDAVGLARVIIYSYYL